MSAIEIKPDGRTSYLRVDPGTVGNTYHWSSAGEYIGKIFFGDENQLILNIIAFDGQVPESLIPNYIGEHPDCLIEGFTACEKPDHCEWMNESRIKIILNHKGSVLVELLPRHSKEPLGGSFTVQGD